MFSFGGIGKLTKNLSMKSNKNTRIEPVDFKVDETFFKVRKVSIRLTKRQMFEALRLKYDIDKVGLKWIDGDPRDGEDDWLTVFDITNGEHYYSPTSFIESIDEWIVLDKVKNYLKRIHKIDIEKDKPFRFEPRVGEDRSYRGRCCTGDQGSPYFHLYYETSYKQIDEA